MKFSIIVPVYNNARFIHIALDSLAKQTFQDFETIIVNDASTDNLTQVVEPYLKKNKSWRLINKPTNGNWGSVINYVVNKKLAHGEYITILDADDAFDKNCLHFVALASYGNQIIITQIKKLAKLKFKKMKVFFQKTGYIKPQRAFTPVSLPLGKFYCSDLFYSLNNLETKIPYQDTVLYNSLTTKAKRIFYIKAPLVTWWSDRTNNSTQAKWDEVRMKNWKKTCQNNLNIKPFNKEINSWVAMYLWELNRNYLNKPEPIITLDPKKCEFRWLPLGLRTIAKIYFFYKIKKWLN